MKKYELSLSRNYVSSWGIEEAIRELLQNAKDSNGEESIDIDKSSGIITITNKNTSISSSTLLLGNTSKKDDLDKIGQFGEGYKLTILVLLREGKDISIYNGNKIWNPSFEYSNNFECEVLCITEIDSTGNDLIFEISGFNDQELDDLENEFLGLNGQSYNSIQTSYGEILTDSSYKGKVFVDGLPVYNDDNFDYGYNFKPCYVTLDRDRKSINIYELKEILNHITLKDKVGLCLDTCHLNDSGVDIAEFDSYLNDLDNAIGLDKVKCIHINDSKNPIGSHKDRHANIGYGTIGFDNLINVLYNSKLKDVPKILETPWVGKYPPYKLEIDMIKSKKFNPNLEQDLEELYKNDPNF